MDSIDNIWFQLKDNINFDYEQKYSLDDEWYVEGHF